MHVYICIEREREWVTECERELARGLLLRRVLYIYIYIYICICIQRERALSRARASRICIVYLHADVCWRMLTHSGVSEYVVVGATIPLWYLLIVCWRMLIYADVCWRMLTYADRCIWTSCRSSNNSTTASSTRTWSSRSRCICVLIILHMCSHTTCYICVLIQFHYGILYSYLKHKEQVYTCVLIILCVLILCVLILLRVLILLHMCPHTTYLSQEMFNILWIAECIRWRMLTYVSWRMLTYADVRMLMYVCWRMLTYPHTTMSGRRSAT
jgi:hypothetical protein